MFYEEIGYDAEMHIFSRTPNPGLNCHGRVQLERNPHGSKRIRRKPVRLKGYDYSRPGTYFVTMCTYQQRSLFGEIRLGEMFCNDAGVMIGLIWQKLPRRFPSLQLDEFVVMPNHVHGILVLLPGNNRQSYLNQSLQPGPITSKEIIHPTLGRVIQVFKSITTHAYIQGVRDERWPSFSKSLWQRSFWDYIIHTHSELQGVRRYIRNNPIRWDLDPLRINQNEVNEPTSLYNQEPWHV